MLRTACDMLDKVYKEQYDHVCDFLMSQISQAAHLGETEVSILTSDWRKECPLVAASEILEDLNTKGYKADLSLSVLTINWEDAEQLCMNRPARTAKISIETTIGNE